MTVSYNLSKTKEVEKTVKELAEYVGAEVLGNGKLSVKGAGSLENATYNDITFISDKKNLPLLQETKSQVVILSEKLQTSKTLLVIPNPKLAFAKILELFYRPSSLKGHIDERAWIEKGTEVASSAIVYPFVSVRQGAKIGERVVLYPGVYVGEEAHIGDDCIIYPNVTIFPKTVLGKRVFIHAGAVIGDDGFGYVWDGHKHYKVPQVGSIVIEDDVEIGSNTAIDRGALDETRIGQGTKIDNLVQVGHNAKIGHHCILCGQVGLAGSVTIEDGAILGGQVGVRDNVKIGAQAQLGGQCGVIGDIAPGAKVWGTPTMDVREYFQTIALLKKLPELVKRIQELESHLPSKKARSINKTTS